MGLVKSGEGATIFEGEERQGGSQVFVIVLCDDTTAALETREEIQSCAISICTNFYLQ